MAKDWAAVAQAINDRLKELELTQMELSSRSGVSPATLRELQYNKNARRRSPRLLAAVSEGLGWPPDHLSKILQGEGGPADQEAEPDGYLDALHALKSEINELRADVIARDQKSKAAAEAQARAFMERLEALERAQERPAEQQ